MYYSTTVEYGYLHHWTFSSDGFKYQNLMDAFYFSFKLRFYTDICIRRFFVSNLPRAK